MLPELEHRFVDRSTMGILRVHTKILHGGGASAEHGRVAVVPFMDASGIVAQAAANVIAGEIAAGLFRGV
jgi:hypothetical protein